MSRGPSLFWCNIWIIIHIFCRVSKETIIIVAIQGADPFAEKLLERKRIPDEAAKRYQIKEEK